MSKFLCLNVNEAMLPNGTRVKSEMSAEDFATAINKGGIISRIPESHKDLKKILDEKFNISILIADHLPNIVFNSGDSIILIHYDYDPALGDEPEKTGNTINPDSFSFSLIEVK